MVNVGKETENVTGKMVVDEGTQTGINILSSIFHGFVGHMSESVVVTETSNILNGFQRVVVYMTVVEERWNVVGMKFSPACCRYYWNRHYTVISFQFTIFFYGF